MLVPLLLFADDMVLVARSRVLVQRLLNALATFCAHTGLVVNLGKTVWMLGGLIPRGFEAGELFYKGSRLQ